MFFKLKFSKPFYLLANAIVSNCLVQSRMERARREKGKPNRAQFPTSLFNLDNLLYLISYIYIYIEILNTHSFAKGSLCQTSLKSTNIIYLLDNSLNRYY